MTSTRGMSEAELRLRTMWEAGLDPIDRNGRPRVPIGTGPYGQRVRGVYSIAQKRAPSESRFLSSRDFLRLYKGVATANMQGVMLNSFVTISWSLAGLTDASSVRQAQAAFQERMTSWFHYLGEAYAGVWVKEVGRTLGLHSHYLLHVPQASASEFRRWVRRTIAKATISDTGPVRRTTGGYPLRVTDVSELGDTVAAQWAVFRYMAKGLDPDGMTSVFSGSRRRMLAAEYTGLSKLSDEGVVIGQRCGRSHAISDAAFRSFQPIYERVMEDQWRSAGRKSFHYGQGFYERAEVNRHLDALGV